MSDPNSGPVTVVLVHGAFADSSGWGGVVKRLEATDTPVRAIVNPLRGINADAAYVAGAIKQIPGRVLAVGHSYGGAVITNAASMTDNVIGLVYVAAYAPDEGESLEEIAATSNDSIIGPALRPTRYPVGADSAPELSIDPAIFHAAFCADLSEVDAAVMGVSQRPLAAAAFTEKTSAPAWRKLPSWAVVGADDKTIGADAVRSMANRAGATITELNTSHVPMISQPDAVTEVIRDALQAAS